MSNKFTAITSAGTNIPVYDKEAHSALSGKQDKLTDYDPSTWNTVTAKQDKLTDEQLSAISSVSSISSTVDGKQDTLTFGYNESNAISSINSSAIAGGGGSSFTGCQVNDPISGNGTEDQPLGVISLELSAGKGITLTTDGDLDATKIEVSVDSLPLTGANGISITATDDSIVVSADNTIMNTSKLEYDGDKISGYDGSAFAGGGSGGSYEGVSPIVVDNTENKISADTVDVTYQQITHDDSLVHVSNSAQYALGVNMSALSPMTDAQLANYIGSGAAVYQKFIEVPFTMTTGNLNTVTADTTHAKYMWIDWSNSFIYNTGSTNILGIGNIGSFYCGSFQDAPYGGLFLRYSASYTGYSGASTAYLTIKYTNDL